MTTVITCGTAIADRARAIKSRQQAMWASGDYAVIGATLQIVGELLNEAADVRPRHRVLDIAAGSGNATIAAARRFARVTSTDYVPALLDRARRRAEAEGFANITFEVADAEALPYTDASFDVVLSTFGVMFAPDHHRAAAELARVCRPGRRIGLASWTPGGFLGRLFGLIAQVRAARPRGPVAPPVGNRRPRARPLSRSVDDRTHDPDVRVPVRIGGALGGGLPDVLRSDSHRLPDARYRWPGRSGGRPDRTPGLGERGRLGRPRRAGRIPRDRDHDMSRSAR